MMSGISGFGLNYASQSLDVHGIRMQVTAHNIANISTNDFQPQHAVFADGNNGRGVALQSVRSATEPFMPANPLHISGTDMAREIPQMMLTERGFEANAATISTGESMLGTLVDMIA